MTINLNNLYKKIKLDENVTAEEEVTKCNIQIYKVIEEILDNKFNESDYKNLFISFLRTIKMCKEYKDSYKDIFSFLSNTSEEILKETGNYNIKDICYIIGTESETPEKYTIADKMSIMTTIGKLLKIKFDF